MFMKRSLITLFSLLLLISLSNNALACACCAEPGTYSISTSKPDPTTLGLLGEMKFKKDATLYTDAAGFDDLKGLTINQELEDADQFDLVSTFVAKTWKFTFKTKDGKTGILTLPIPTQMLSFKVDLHDKEPNIDPSLYKEFRFKGTASSGTGIFKGGIIKPTSYFLVFQGRGNMCDNASDFTHWRLEITGSKSDYAFFGKMDN
jgi:hypothetical protein